MTRVLTRILRLVLAAAALAVVAAGGLDLWLRTSLPQTAGEVVAPGLGGSAEIARDASGLVHIRAANMADAYFALGFAHAQDRLWQMEATRRLGRGRLSEIAGARFIGQDRMMRTLGIGRLADASFARLSPEVRSGLEAYARGVNAFLASRSGALPPEFALLFHRPEPWQPADSLIWGRLMALSLSGNWRRQLARARLTERLDDGQIRRLYPAYPEDAPVTVDEARRAATGPQGGGLAPVPDTAARIVLDALASAIPEAPAADTASNSWVVAGTRTASGKPLLANDPHLGLRAPNVWYLARIDTPDFSVAGATAPGVPFHVLGHNGTIAWSMTTTGADSQDLVIERLPADDVNSYIAPDGPKPFLTREESLKVRFGEPVRFPVRETRNGPVVSDLYRADEGLAAAGTVVTLRSPVLAEDDTTAEALYRINRARDWAGFAAALAKFHAPVQNIFYADTAGRIGFSVAGRIPVRNGRDGSLPADGTRADDDWSGFIPPDALPRSVDPARGYLANANNRVVGPGYPFAIARDWEEPWRALRLEELVAARPHDEARARAIQLDTLSAAARRLLPEMLRLTERQADIAPLLDRLARWDFRFGRDRPEPLIYTAWTTRLMTRLYADELGPHYRDFSRVRPLLILRTLADDPSWCNDVATVVERETCPQSLARALADARADLTRAQGSDIAAWRWSAAHRATLGNQALDWLPLIGRLSRITVATDGDDFTLNRGTSRGGARNGEFPHAHGATLRAIYDLARPDGSLFAMPGGQSGNPLSPHYRDLTLPWRDGAYVTLPAAPSGRMDRLRLLPAAVERPGGSGPGQS